MFFSDTESSLKLNLEAKKVSQRHFVLPAVCTDGLRLARYAGSSRASVSEVCTRASVSEASSELRWRRRVTPALLKSVDAVSPILLSRKIPEQLLSSHHPSMISHAMVVNHEKTLSEKGGTN